MLEHCNNRLVTRQDIRMNEERNFTPDVVVIPPVDVAIGLFDHCRASGSLHSVMCEQIFPSPDAFSRLRLKEYNVMGNFNPMFSGDRHSLLNCTLRSALRFFSTLPSAPVRRGGMFAVPK